MCGIDYIKCMLVKWLSLIPFNFIIVLPKAHRMAWITKPSPPCLDSKRTPCDVPITGHDTHRSIWLSNGKCAGSVVGARFAGSARCPTAPCRAKPPRGLGP